MAKHRKTRQEKMVADQRHVVYHLDTNPAQVSKVSEKKSDHATYNLDLPTHRATTINYSHIKSDLRKTSLITSAIIIAQIFLFIILNRI